MPGCRSCSATVFWVATAKTGKPMPLDAEPVKDGNVIIEGGRAVTLGPLELALLGDSVNRYRSHFVTCPHAQLWRAADKEAARG